MGGRGTKEGLLRRTANPTAVPRATGNRIDAAGFAKIAAGSVREGMKVVMVGFPSAVVSTSVLIDR